MNTIIALEFCILTGLLQAVAAGSAAEIAYRRQPLFAFFFLGNGMASLIGMGYAAMTGTQLPADMKPLMLILAGMGLCNMLSQITRLKSYDIGNRALLAAFETGALLVPLLVSTCLFGERPGWFGFLGLTLLTSGMMLAVLSRHFFRSKTGSSATSGTQTRSTPVTITWLCLAVLYFVFVGLNQTLGLLPTFLHLGNLSGLWRAALVMMFSSCGHLSIVGMQAAKGTPDAFPFRRIWFWAFLWALMGLACNTMLFLSIDRMHLAGIGGMTTAVCASVSMLAFTLYTRRRFHENYPTCCYFGMVMCLLGVLVLGMRG